MPENEFEKNVQDKLDELKLRPSESVWTAVELELQKKKKRKFAAFILLFAALGLFGLSGYFLFTHSKSSFVSDQKSLPVEHKAGSSYNNNSDPSQQTGVTSLQADNNKLTTKRNDLPVAEKDNSNSEEIIDLNKKENLVSEDKKIVSALAGNKKPAGEAKHLMSPKLQEKTTKTNDSQITEDKDLPVNDENNRQETVAISTTGKKAGEQPANPQNNKVENANDIAEPNAAPVSTKENKTGDTVLQKADSLTAANLTTEKTIAAKNKKPGSKIKWGLDFSGGITSSRSNALSLATRESFADVQTNGFVGSPAQQPPYYGVTPPSSVQPGPGFKAGLAAEKQLSKRSSLSVGLRYVYLSEKINVGRYTDTFYVRNSYSPSGITNGFYGGSQQRQHTNRYHFIEMPFTYHLQLNKSSKLPVLWDVGVSVAYLAGTNALVYDSAMGGIYYKQENVFNKMHVNFNSGFSLRFGSKVQWSLGPEVSLDLSRLTNQELSTRKRYLLYGGLSAKLFFAGKKK